MRFSQYALVLLACVTVFSLSSCKKNKLNKQTTTAEDNALAEDSFDEIFKTINETADEENLDGTAKMGIAKDYTFSSHCATITLNPPAWDSNGVWNPVFPKTLTIDFGTTNCTGKDGKARRGKIISVYSGKYKETGTIVTTTLDNYHVNDYHVEGTKTVTTTAANSFSIEVDGTITSPDGNDEVSWVSSRTRTWIEGQNTNFFTPAPGGGWMQLDGITDDVYSVTGTASGVNRNGRAFTAEITTALRIEFCGWIPEITQGIIEIQPDDLKLRKVDFGDLECDRTYVVTIGKKSYTRTY